MSTSLKEKKIRIKFFLNGAVEPVTGEKGQKYYPLYIQVTYNRKNMQFRSKYGLSYNNLKEVDTRLMAFEEQLLTKIIRHEAAEREIDYELRGLKRKYETYSTSIYQTLEEHLKPQLRLAILKTGSELINVLNFYQPQATVTLLYKAATVLFPHFTSTLSQKLKDNLEAYFFYQQLDPDITLSFGFPTLIDWVEGTHQSELVTLVRASKKNDSATVKRITTLISQAAQEHLKALNDLKQQPYTHIDNQQVVF